MWESIVERFQDSPQRLKVAETIIRHGMHIEDVGIVKCGEVRVPLKAIGDALGIDRRTVRATTEDVCSDDELCGFFSSLRPAGPSLEKVSRQFGYGVVTIYVEAPENPGILSDVTSTIAGHNIAIRQVIAEDVAIYRQPCLKVITRDPLPGRVIEVLASIEGVSRVIIDK
ncbi:MAG: amino acid-binding protein [Candidatus Thorarchaeota archaeon]|nr:MAG: amino acid-binding protein [Candidatus Thorarchaeota archaeon]